MGEGDAVYSMAKRDGRFVGAIFTFAVPCVVLLLVDLFDAGPLPLALAALSAALGRAIEQRTFESILADRPRAA